MFWGRRKIVKTVNLENWKCWSCPTLGLPSVLMFRPISPELVLFLDFWVSNIPRYFCFRFHFLSIFSKLSSRPQVKLINIHENFGVFIFNRIPVSMQYMLSLCNFMFCKSITHYFCFRFLRSYSVWYPCVQKLQRVTYFAVGINFSPNITSGESWNMAERVNDLTRIETSLVAGSSL